MSGELQKFKADISLCDYAATHGYQTNTKKSSAHSIVMDKAEHRIVVSKASDGHDAYFSVKGGAGPRDQGSVIDFAKNRTGKNLGFIRQELRPWIGRSPRPVPTTLPAAHKPVRPKKPTSGSAEKRQAAARKLAAMTPPQPNNVFLRRRRIRAKMLEMRRFADQILIDQQNKHQNIIFPHYDQDGLCGYGIRNRNFKGFEGQKGLWCSVRTKNDDRIVITESALDALAHAELRGQLATTRYLSLEGAMSPRQLDLIESAVAAKPEAKIVLAFDNDDAGHEYAKRIRDRLPDREIELDVPARPGADWNDQLKFEKLTHDCKAAMERQEQGYEFDEIVDEIAEKAAPEMALSDRQAELYAKTVMFSVIDAERDIEDAEREAEKAESEAEQIIADADQEVQRIEQEGAQEVEAVEIQPAAPGVAGAGGGADPNGGDDKKSGSGKGGDDEESEKKSAGASAGAGAPASPAPEIIAASHATTTFDGMDPKLEAAVTTPATKPQL